MSNEHLPTPIQAALRLGEMNREMNALCDTYESLQREAAVKKKTSRDVEARAFLSHDGAMDARKWHARKVASDVLYEYDLAERLVDVMAKRIFALGREMANGQTIGATARKELETLGAQQ